VLGAPGVTNVAMSKRPAIKWRKVDKHNFVDGEWSMSYKLGIWTLCKEGVAQAAGTRLEMFNKRRGLQKLSTPSKSVDYRTACNRSIFALMRDCDEECLDVYAREGDAWVPLCDKAVSKDEVIAFLVKEPENMANVKIAAKDALPSWLVAGAHVCEPLHNTAFSVVKSVLKQKVTHRRDGEQCDAHHAWHQRRFVPASLRPYTDMDELQKAMETHGDKVMYIDGSVKTSHSVIASYDEHGIEVDGRHMDFMEAVRRLMWADRHAFGIYEVAK
jgi:hypothetical protein